MSRLKRLMLGILLVVGIGSASAQEAENPKEGNLFQNAWNGLTEAVEDVGDFFSGNKPGGTDLAGDFESVAGGDDPMQAAEAEYGNKLMEILSSNGYDAGSRCYALQYLALDSVEAVSDTHQQQIDEAKNKAIYVLHDQYRISTPIHMYQAETGALTGDELEDEVRNYWRDFVGESSVTEYKALLDLAKQYLDNDRDDGDNDNLAELVTDRIMGSVDAEELFRAGIVELLQAGPVDFESPEFASLVEKATEASQKTALADEAVEVTRGWEGPTS